MFMETKSDESPALAEMLANCELLPDGSTTANQQVWLQSWAEFAQKQVLTGKIKLHEVKEYDPDTGQVPNTFIKELYLKNRKLH